MDQDQVFSMSLYVEEEHREEQELSAFILAVSELFGPEEARRSERIWLAEADLIDSPPLSAERNISAVSIAASFRLREGKDWVTPITFH